MLWRGDCAGADRNDDSQGVRENQEEQDVIHARKEQWSRCQRHKGEQTSPQDSGQTLEISARFY